MSYQRNLARLARSGMGSHPTAQDLRTQSVYAGVIPSMAATRGALADGDGGGGIWEWDPNSNAEDNFATVLLPQNHAGPGQYERQRERPVHWKFFGDADPAVAIQKALDAFKVVYLGEKGDIIEPLQTIYMDDDCVLTGDFPTYRRKQGLTPVFDLIANKDTNNGNNHLRVERLIIDGQQSADGLDLTVPEHRFCGICFIKCNASGVIDCDVKGTVNNETGGGIYLVDCYDPYIRFCRISEHNGSGVVAFDCHRYLLEGNHAWNCSGSGTTGNNYGMRVIGNHVHDCGFAPVGNYTGLSCTTLGEGSTIVGNHSHDNTGGGIIVGHSLDVFRGSTVMGNVCYRNGLEGLINLGGGGTLFSGNVLWENVRNNMRFMENATEAIICNNWIEGATGGQGIRLDSGSNYQILGNRIKDGNYTGVLISKDVSKVLISSNQIYNNGRLVPGATGAGIQLNDCYDIQIEGNVFWDDAAGTQRYAIQQFGSNASYFNNDFSGCVEPLDLRNTGNGNFVYTVRSNRWGTDPTYFQINDCPAGGTEHTILNNNVWIPGQILILPINVTAAIRPTPWVSAWETGVSFTMTLSNPYPAHPDLDAFWGSEAYAIHLLN